MCLYGPPRSFTSADRITYPASGNDRDDLEEAGAVLPVGDPRLELRELALHELQAAR
jgi:hypothetical protein